MKGKKIFSKLRSRCKNVGSGVVLVIVAIGFIGILVGSMLTAVGYAYRLKLYDYNAKDNFYYLEQAMDEIYTGVGNFSLSIMSDSYTSILDNMGVDADSTEMNNDFKRLFMKSLASSDQFSEDKVADFLRSYVSNTDVMLVSDDTHHTVPAVLCFDLSGDPVYPTEFDTKEIGSIVIKNVTLTRTGTYKRSTANGDFEQTISADITVVRPDFEMSFKTLNLNYSALFDFAMVADNGIEIYAPGGDNNKDISISGNIYAAADFYDKEYNKKSKAVSGYSSNSQVIGVDENKYYSTGGNTKDAETDTIVGSQGVASVVRSGKGSSAVTYYNFDNASVSSNTTHTNAASFAKNGVTTTYDGVSEQSLYSGLYVKNANVILQSSEVIVPGTIAVLADSGNNSSLTIYGKSGASVAESDVWTDNIVLGNKDVDFGGSTWGTKTVEGESQAAVGKDVINSKYPKLLARANLHVRDDMELNADGASVELAGHYYGFGNGTKADARKYLTSATGNSLVDQTTFSYLDGTTRKNRAHFNSSAIVVNGQDVSLSLEKLSTLFLAGRTYIELSRNKAPASTDTTGTGTQSAVVTSTQRNKDDFDDYRTGESLSLKSSQIAYGPLNITGVTTKDITENNVTTTVAEITPDAVKNSVLFSAVLQCQPDEDGVMVVPVKKYDTTDGTQFYFDFETIYQKNFADKNINTINFLYKFGTNETDDQDYDEIEQTLRIDDADELSRQFIVYYQRELLNYAEGSARAYLKDIKDVGGFQFVNGSVLVPLSENSLYSAGAITLKDGADFRLTGSLEGETNFEVFDPSSFSNDNTDDSNLNSNGNFTGSVKDEYTDQLKTATSVRNKTPINVANLADDMETRYQYVKWSLENFNSMEDAAELNYVDNVYKNTKDSEGNYKINGEGDLTPLNRYLNMGMIPATPITPSSFQLDSGYSVWISDSDVTISDTDGDGVVQGLVITKGNVAFDGSVSRFEGLIISGDKIFVENRTGAVGTGSASGKTLTSISASPEVVRSIMKECIGKVDQASAKKILQMFKSYETNAYATLEESSTEMTVRTVETVKSSEIVSFSNWMKNVADAPKEDTDH